jgi:hypothetical protein
MSKLLDPEKLSKVATRKDGRDKVVFTLKDAVEMAGEAEALSVNLAETRKMLGGWLYPRRYREARLVHAQHDYLAIQNINAVRKRRGGIGLGVGRDAYEGNRTGPLVRLIEELFRQLNLPNCPSPGKIQDAALTELPTE